MDKDFETLLSETKKIVKKRVLNEYAYCGHVGCALLTKKGNIYTGICLDTNCALGNCAEYGAIIDMLKHNESEIVKIVAYAAKGKIYAPCGRCRDLIRMVNMDNLDADVMVAENRVVKLKELLPEIYITKES